MSASTFSLDDDEALTLVDVSDLRPASGVSSFALLFVGDTELPQGTYTLRHGELGDVTLFLVPVGVSDRGREYEAVFSTLDEAASA